MPIRIDGGEIKLIPPGQVVRYRMMFHAVPTMLHVDEPLRAFVVDSHKRKTWGIAIPMFRRMMASGWVPPPETDLRLLEPPPEPWLPKPLFKRWQVWKPRHLRTLDPLEKAVAGAVSSQRDKSGLQSES
jgi:hypothetical protein